MKILEVKRLKIDLHGFELATAKTELYYALKECIMNNDDEIEIVHGYQHGSVLKNYIESNYFIQDMKKSGFILRLKSMPNQGSTIFTVSKSTNTR